MPQTKKLLDLFRIPVPRDEDEEWKAERRAKLFQNVFDTIADILQRHWDPDDISDFNDRVAMLGSKGIAAAIPAEKDSFYLVLPDGKDFSITPTYLLKSDSGDKRCHLVTGGIIFFVKKHHEFELIDENLGHAFPIVIECPPYEHDIDCEIFRTSDPVGEDPYIFAFPLHIVPMRSGSGSGADSEEEAMRLAVEQDNLEIRVFIASDQQGEGLLPYPLN